MGYIPNPHYSRSKAPGVARAAALPLQHTRVAMAQDKSGAEAARAARVQVRAAQRLAWRVVGAAGASHSTGRQACLQLCVRMHALTSTRALQCRHLRHPQRRLQALAARCFCSTTTAAAATRMHSPHHL